MRLVPRGLRTASVGTTTASSASVARDFSGACGTLHLGPRSGWPGAGLSQSAGLRAGSAPVGIESVWQAIQADDAARLGVSLGNIRINNDPLAVAAADGHGLSVGSGGWDGALWAASPGSVGLKRKSCDLAATRGPSTIGEAVSPDRTRFAGDALSPDGKAVQQLDEAMQVRTPALVMDPRFTETPTPNAPLPASITSTLAINHSPDYSQQSLDLADHLHGRPGSCVR